MVSVLMVMENAYVDIFPNNVPDFLLKVEENYFSGSPLHISGFKLRVVENFKIKRYLAEHCFDFLNGESTKHPLENLANLLKPRNRHNKINEYLEKPNIAIPFIFMEIL